MVLKNTAFNSNCTIVTLQNLIIKFLYSLVQFGLILLKYAISYLHSLVKLFIII